MLDIKQWIKKVTDWLNTVGYGEPTDYSSALYNATLNAPWTAPKSGMMVITAGTNGGARAYWYIVDATIGINMAHATRLETANYMLGASFPVIKGHKYYSQKANISSAQGHLYPIVGGGEINNLLKALPSLAYRGGGASVECKGTAKAYFNDFARTIYNATINNKDSLTDQKYFSEARHNLCANGTDSRRLHGGCNSRQRAKSRQQCLHNVRNGVEYIRLQFSVICPKHNPNAHLFIFKGHPVRLTASVKGVAVC